MSLQGRVAGVGDFHRHLSLLPRREHGNCPNIPRHLFVRSDQKPDRGGVVDARIVENQRERRFGHRRHVGGNEDVANDRRYIAEANLIHGRAIPEQSRIKLQTGTWPPNCFCFVAQQPREHEGFS